MKRALLALGVVAGSVAACRGRTGGAEGAAAAAVQVETARVIEESLAEVVRAIGTVTPRPGRFAELASPAPTRVARIFVSPGQRVALGDTLIELERTGFDAAATSADAALETAQRAYVRAARLVEAGILPQKDSEQASADLAQARAAAINARRTEQLATLRAPLAGIVTRMTAVLGQPADPSQPLVTVVDPKALDMVFSVTPGEAGRIRTGDSLSVTAGEGAGGEPLGSGVVAAIGAEIDSASRAVPVRVEMARQRRPPRIGETVFGQIVTGIHTRAVTVPMVALVPAGDGYQVFVVDSTGIARARPVTVGVRSGTRGEILTGLRAGETVVATGAYGIEDGTRIRFAPSPR